MEKMCNVKNRGAGYVTYKIPEDGIRRSFAPGEVKQISLKELEKLTYQTGGMVLLTRFLQVQDDSVLSAFGMNVEPEYHMSERDVMNLLTTGSLDAFLDALDFAPDGVIDLIKKFSVDLPLTDIEKRKALKKKTGFDVDKALQHIEEEKEDDNKTILKQSSERRVKPEAAAPGRRTTAPKYNVVSKPAEEKAETKTEESAE